MIRNNLFDQSCKEYPLYRMENDTLECHRHLLPEFIKKVYEDGTEHIHYPAVCDILPKDFELYARTDLNETEENKEKGIRKLREFVKKENLKCFDDSYLIMVLRTCKYDMKKCESKLKLFLNIRSHIITELAKIDMKTIEILIDGDFCRILPYRDRYGRLIFYTLPRLQLDKYKVEEAGYFYGAFFLFWLSFPMTQVCGIAYVADNTCENISIYYYLIKLYKKFIPKFLGALPYRIRRIDFTNENIVCHWFYPIIRPLLPEKIAKRVAFHGTNFKELHNHYHVDLLPKEVCGKLGTFSNMYFKAELLNFIEKLRAEN